MNYSAEDTYRKTLMTYYIYARDPLVNHFHRLDPSVPVTYMWGQKSPIPGVRSQTELEKLRGNLGGYCKFVVSLHCLLGNCITQCYYCVL